MLDRSAWPCIVSGVFSEHLQLDFGDGNGGIVWLAWTTLADLEGYDVLG